MIPWEELDVATVPGSSNRLRLMRRGDEYSIMLGTNELMNSRLSGSEETLARLTCEPLRSREAPRVLIGGLGMGFTLRAALSCLNEDADVVIAEIVPEVVAWARGPLASVFQGCLDDRRVTVAVDDVGRVIRSQRLRWDAILLDVDNGPDGISREGNDALYSAAGLRSARDALRPGGVLAVWSSAPSAPFTRRLEAGGFAVTETPARARPNGRGARHVIWTATKGA